MSGAFGIEVVLAFDMLRAQGDQGAASALPGAQHGELPARLELILGATALLVHVAVQIVRPDKHVTSCLHWSQECQATCCSWWRMLCTAVCHACAVCQQKESSRFPATTQLNVNLNVS